MQIIWQSFGLENSAAHTYNNCLKILGREFACKSLLLKTASLQSIVPMRTPLQSDLLYLLRSVGAVLLAAIIVFIPTCFVLWEVRKSGNILENGPVEWVQLALLLCASIAYGIRAYVTRDGSGPSRAFALCALFVLAMCIRELDGYFDVVTGNHHFWSYIVAPVVLAAVAIFVCSFSRSVHDLTEFASGHEMPLLAVGAVLGIVFAQIIGYKEVWSDVFNLPIWQAAVEQYLQEGELPASMDIQRHVKNIVEECAEIGSYLMILFSAILPPLLARRR